MLESKLREVRREEAKIGKKLASIGDFDHTDRDIALFQFFILEQFTTFKKYVMTFQLFSFPGTTPKPVHPIVWFICWAFVILSVLFYIYWIFAWAGKIMRYFLQLQYLGKSLMLLLTFSD